MAEPRTGRQRAQLDDEQQPDDREVRPADAGDDRKRGRRTQGARQAAGHRQRHRERGLQEHQQRQATDDQQLALREHQQDEERDEDDLQDEETPNHAAVDGDDHFRRLHVAVRRAPQDFERVLVGAEPHRDRDQPSDEGDAAEDREQRQHHQRDERRAADRIQDDRGDALPERFGRRRRGARRGTHCALPARRSTCVPLTALSWSLSTSSYTRSSSDFAFGSRRTWRASGSSDQVPVLASAACVLSV